MPTGTLSADPFRTYNNPPLPTTKRKATMPGRPYILSETSWKAVRNTQFEVAVLPWGATEAHNYHLPYGTDNIQNDHVAAAAAGRAWNAGARVIVLPGVPFGVNTGQLDVVLDINMNPSTQLAVLGDVVDALDHQGIPKLLILNGHGANDFRQMVRELMPRTSLFICTVDWYRWIDPEIFEEPGDHAGEMETSLMQLLTPEWVLPLTEAGAGTEHPFKLKGLREGFAWAQRDWLKATDDTGAGNPGDASPEKGQRCLDQIAARLGDFLVELAAADVDDLYE